MAKKQPRAWMRRWAFDGEKPHQERNQNTKRMAVPAKFKLHAVTLSQAMPDDVPLYAADDDRVALPGTVREFLEHWSHEGHLQTFEDRERFRKAARELLASGVIGTKVENGGSDAA